MAATLLIILYCACAVSVCLCIFLYISVSVSASHCQHILMLYFHILLSLMFGDVAVAVAVHCGDVTGVESVD